MRTVEPTTLDRIQWECVSDRVSDPLSETLRLIDVARMTVNVAYEQLAGEGFVNSRPGAGTFVSDLVARVVHEPRKRRPAGALQPRAIWQPRRVPTPFAQPARFDFRTGLPDGSFFPPRAWQRCVVRALLSSESIAGVYADPSGLRDLRLTIVRHIGFSSGVEASADDVVVTSGTQQALDLAALARGKTAEQVEKFAHRASERSVAVQMLPSAKTTGRAGLTLGYGAIPTSRIKEGLRLLRTCFDSA